MTRILEHCPFCGAGFDPTDLAQVLQHYGHQLDAGAPAAIALDPGEDFMRWENTDESWDGIVALHRDLETVAFRQSDGTLDVETNDGRQIVPIGGWLVRRDDGSLEVYPP